MAVARGGHSAMMSSRTRSGKSDKRARGGREPRQDRERQRGKGSGILRGRQEEGDDWCGGHKCGNRARERQLMPAMRRADGLRAWRIEILVLVNRDVSRL